MIKNYLLTSIRLIMRNKVHSTINVFGLAIGMACSLLIFIWVQDEFSFDSFHQKSDRIYRLTPYWPFPEMSRLAVTPAPLGEILQNKYPEIETYCRTFMGSNLVFRYKKVKDKELHCLFVDKSFFDIFSFPLIMGDAQKCLIDTHSVVISEAVSKKYFGNENPIGKKILCENRFELTVVAVVKNAPANSKLQFDWVLPLSLLSSEFGMDLSNWGIFDYMTFLLMKPDFEFTETYTIQNFYNDFDSIPSDKKLFLQPITDIHLFSNCIADFESNREIKYVYLLISIAFIILLIACINFINLTTAKSVKRSREVGIRKVTGAMRRDLILQFYGEAFFYAFVSLIVAVGLVELFAPIFSNLSGKQMDIHNYNNLHIVLFLLSILSVTTLISGSYPAILLSAFPPAIVLKINLQKRRGRGAFFRKSLVVFQFGIASLLIVTSLIIFDQLQYIMNKPLGYNDKQLIEIGVEGRIATNIEQFKKQLVAHPSIFSATATASSPLYTTSSSGWQPSDSSEVLRIHFTQVDEDFVPTFGLKMLKGTDFLVDTASKPSQFILNLEALKQLHLSDSVVGSEFLFADEAGVIVGIVNDYHFLNLKEKIAPMLLQYTNSDYELLYLKVDENQIDVVKNFIQQTWNEFEPDIPVKIKYYGEMFGETYQQEQKTAITFQYFSVLAIIISCLGLFGLSQFMTEQRIKEIGVRKTLGATILSIVLLLSVDYIKWVIVATFVSFPVAYFLSEWWLKTYAYHTPIHFLNFGITALIIIAIAISTVLFQVIKTASNNLVDALRNE